MERGRCNGDDSSIAPSTDIETQRRETGDAPVGAD
jgi:hypothetical protein